VEIDNKKSVNRCPSCGSPKIIFNKKTGKLQCKYCKIETEGKRFKKVQTDLRELTGVIYGSGAHEIIADASDVLTFKCDSCGAEVVIDTSESVNARCHWCRSDLSVNQQIPNGVIPDMVLPFTITKEEAQKEINNFVGRRKFFTCTRFKKEFCTKNIIGVYLPYMVLDVNAKSMLSGFGEQLIRTESTDNSTTYISNNFRVERNFDFVIAGLTMESSKEKIQHHSSEKTNNVINAIMPFDTENALEWNGTYLKGYASEKRNINPSQLSFLATQQIQDIARHSIVDSLVVYDRGVAWEEEKINLKGKQWKTAYLPVWLYSYQEVKGDKRILHYVAVNGRTAKTMGSIPINKPKLFISALILQLSIIIPLQIFLATTGPAWVVIMLLISFLYIMPSFIFIRNRLKKYRNLCVRFEHEKQTRRHILNLQKKDTYFGETRSASNIIIGQNHLNVSNHRTTGKIKDRINIYPSGNMIVNGQLVQDKRGRPATNTLARFWQYFKTFPMGSFYFIIVAVIVVSSFWLESLYFTGRGRIGDVSYYARVRIPENWEKDRYNPKITNGTCDFTSYFYFRPGLRIKSVMDQKYDIIDLQHVTIEGEIANVFISNNRHYKVIAYSKTYASNGADGTGVIIVEMSAVSETAFNSCREDFEFLTRTLRVGFTDHTDD